MGGEDHVKLLAAQLGEDAIGVGDVGLEEAGLDTQLVRQAPGVCDRLLRSQPLSPGAAARPRQGVETEVALQVEERFALDITDSLNLDGVQGVASCLEALDIVEIALDVELGPTVPEVAVGTDAGVGDGGARVCGVYRRGAGRSLGRAVARCLWAAARDYAVVGVSLRGLSPTSVASVRCRCRPGAAWA